MSELRMKNRSVLHYIEKHKIVFHHLRVGGLVGRLVGFG